MKTIIYSACLALLISACAAAGGPTFAVTGQVMSGPTCAVESTPPDPTCAPHQVADAEMVVLDMDGNQVASVVSAADGSFRIDLPAGDYQLVPQPSEGLMGTAEPVTFQLGDAPLGLDPIFYDTGVR